MVSLTPADSKESVGGDKHHIGRVCLLRTYFLCHAKGNPVNLTSAKVYKIVNPATVWLLHCQLTPHPIVGIQHSSLVPWPQLLSTNEHPPSPNPHPHPASSFPSCAFFPESQQIFSLHNTPVFLMFISLPSRKQRQPSMLIHCKLV